MSKLIIALYVLITSAGLVILKLGTDKGAPLSIMDGKVAANINLYTVGGAFLYGVSFILYMYLISKYDLGYIIPLAAAFVYVLIFFASYFIFKESFTLIKVLGIVLIVVGLLLLNINKK